MISSELLKRVLGYENEVSIIRIVKNYRDIKYDVLSPINGHYTETINIYELVHKCKRWAELNGCGFVLCSSTYNNNGYCEIKKITEKRLVSVMWQPDQFKSEVEAVIKACQWILDNKDKE